MTDRTGIPMRPLPPRPDPGAERMRELEAVRFTPQHRRNQARKKAAILSDAEVAAIRRSSTRLTKGNLAQSRELRKN